MKVFKKSIFALMLSCGLLQSQANAGLLVGALSGDVGLGVAVGGGLGLVGATMGSAVIGTSFWSWCQLLVIPGVILDYSVSADATTAHIENVIAHELPMIEDREVVRDIAKATHAKLLAQGQTHASGEIRVIKFKDTEVETLIESLVLSGAEREEIRRVLQ